MDNPTTSVEEEGTVRGTTVALASSSKASGLALTEGESIYHANQPPHSVMRELEKLLEFDAVDALIQFMPSIIKTVGVVIENTARRDVMTGAAAQGSVTLDGLKVALQMSLMDFTTAVAEAGAIETPMVEEIRALIVKEREAGTLAATKSAAEAKTPGLILP